MSNQDDTMNIKRTRGKGKIPAMTRTNLRILDSVLEFYRGYPSYTVKMREVLTSYASEHKDKTST